MGKIRLTEAQLKSIIKKAVKRALCESSNYGTTLWGDDFVNVTIEKFGNGINEDEVLNDPNVDDIFQSKFEIKATYIDEPASWDSPGGTDFYIDEDDGLYDLIELIKNPKLRDMFERAYDKLITTGELGNYEFIGPEEPEYPELDESKINDKQLRRLISESIRKVLNEADSYGDLNSRERAEREKKAQEICTNMGFTQFWRNYNLLCVELQNNGESCKVSYDEVWGRAKKIENALKRYLGGDVRVDCETRGVADNDMCISSYAKLYV